MFISGLSNFNMAFVLLIKIFKLFEIKLDFLLRKFNFLRETIQASWETEPISSFSGVDGLLS